MAVANYELDIPILGLEVVYSVACVCSFIVEFTSRTPDAEKDSESVQNFLIATEGAFEAHPLFVDATDEELDSAGEVSPPVHQSRAILYELWYARREEMALFQCTHTKTDESLMIGVCSEGKFLSV